MEESPGSALARSLLGAFTAMVDEVVAELERRGHPGVTATHEFALQAVDEGARSASALGRRLKVSKQAAAKSIAALEELGYLDRRGDPADARRKILQVTPHGHEMMTIGAATFDRLRSRLCSQVGPRELAAFESVLRTLATAEASGTVDGADAAVGEDRGVPDAVGVELSQG